jgi:hypothetical protein
MIQEKWNDLCDSVTDQMKEFTRPHVAILAGAAGKPTEIGTGSFIEHGGVEILTCEHVARFNPTACFIDAHGHTEIAAGRWKVEANPSIDVALSEVCPAQWNSLPATAKPIPFSKIPAQNTGVQDELYFFRGVAGENTHLSAFGVDVIISGYCSQQKRGTGDVNVFELLWEPNETTVTSNTEEGVRARVKKDNPAGFSGSLVWNTRFVELGCDLSEWSPEDAVIAGLLRRYDPSTSTLLVWRVEHLHAWLET